MNNNSTKILARPLNMPCGVTLSNRIVKSAMSECLATFDSSDPSKELCNLYERWSLGGAGLLITGNVMVSPEGIGEPGNVISRPDSPLEPYRIWSKAATIHGNNCFMQINHAGRQSPKLLNENPVAPSSISVKLVGMFGKPRALEIEEIEDIITKFAHTAKLSKDAGFTGVQMHGAHGYLISQFLSPLSNQRKDKYGGSLENRMRFLIECYRKIRKACGKNYPICLKLNSADFLRGGFTSEEAVIVARTISEEGIDILEISGGTFEKPEMFMPPKESTTEREAHFLEYARLIRKKITCPLMLTGGLRTPNVMAKIIEDGSIDLVGLARPMALEPNFAREILEGRIESSKVERRRTFFKVLAPVIDGGWYQQQIHRISKGKEPQLTASTLSMLWTLIRSFQKKGKHLKNNKKVIRGHY